jgi:hypothetical protein
MPTIELNHEQAETLRRTLEVALSSLRFEIAHTDHRDFRDMLRRREQILESLLSATALV